MKRLITLIPFTVLPFALFGQITLNQAGYAGWTAGVDSIRVIDSAAAAGLVFTTGANQSWDISSKTYTATNYFSTKTTGTSASFPGSTYKYDIGGALAGLINFQAVGWAGISAAGINFLGVDVTRQAFPLGSFTGSPFDSLVFPTQSVLFSSPEHIIQFPATFPGSWTSDYVGTVDFNLTILLGGYANAPGFRRTYSTSNDQVSGWGKMKVYNPFTSSSAPFIDVLQIRKHVQTIDSFYINGNPIPDAELSALGLSQGMETDYFTEFFYRTGEVTPFVEISYLDGSYTTINEIDVHTQRLSATTVHEISFDNNASIYPNPVTDHRIHVQLSENSSGSYSYELLNALGQKMQTGILYFINGVASANINETAPGLYYLSVKDSKGQVSAKPLLIQ